jgi:hypothetical protein
MGRLLGRRQAGRTLLSAERNAGKGIRSLDETWI